MQCPTVLCAASNNSSCIWYAMPQIVWTTSNACPMFFTFQTPKCRLSELSFSVGSTLIDSSCQHLTAITVGPHGVRSTGTGACIPHGVRMYSSQNLSHSLVNCMYNNCILYIRMYYKQSLQTLNDVTILLVPIFVWYYRFVSKSGSKLFLTSYMTKFCILKRLEINRKLNSLICFTKHTCTNTAPTVKDPPECGYYTTVKNSY